jgi:hypothetical protein
MPGNGHCYREAVNRYSGVTVSPVTRLFSARSQEPSSLIASERRTVAPGRTVWQSRALETRLPPRQSQSTTQHTLAPRLPERCSTSQSRTGSSIAEAQVTVARTTLISGSGRRQPSASATASEAARHAGLTRIPESQGSMRA